MESKINTFIFDCFGVVCSTPFFSWQKDNMTARGLTDNKIWDIYRESDLGNLKEEDVALYFSKYQGITSTKEQIQEQVDNYLSIDGKVVKIIRELKQKGFKIVLLSNGNNSFFERKVYPTYPEFKSLFDEIIISSKVKMVKPDKEIYLYTLKQISSKPEETLFIDDSKINVDSVVSLKINGFLYTDSDSLAGYIKSLGINLKD